MRREDQVKELFDMNIKQLEQAYSHKARVTVKGIWVSIMFGTNQENLFTVKGRGYLNALRLLDDKLESLIE